MTATSQEDHPSPLRLHISPLPPALAHDPSDLISRLSLFGTPLTPLSVHKKPAALSSFAFITVEMSKAQYAALRKSLNGVKYKGGVIKIDIARAPSFEERQKILREQHADDDEERKKEQIDAARKESLTRRKHLRALEKLMHHIRRSRYQFGKLEHGGRMRDNPRDFRKNPPTFRVKIGGKSKVVKCKKQKLWGAAKVGNLNEFVWRFDEEGERVVRDGKVLVGRWLNGYGDTIEVFRREIIQIEDFEKLKAEFDFGEAAASLTKDYNFEVVRSTAPDGKEETEEEKQQRVEREKSLKILQDMFGGANSDDDDDATATRKLEDEDSDDDDAIYQIINAAKPKHEPEHIETEEIEEETTEKDEKVVEMDDDEPEVDAMDVEEKVQSEAESDDTGLFDGIALPLSNDPSKDAESEDSDLFDGIEIAAAEEQKPESESGSESDDSGLFNGIEIPEANADDDENASDSDDSLAGKPYMPFYGLRGGAADYSESSSSEDSDEEDDESDEEDSSTKNDSRKEEDTNSDSSESVSSSSDDDSDSAEKSSAADSDSDDSSDEESSSSSSSSESDDESSSEDEEEDKSRQKMEIDNAASDSSEHEATSSSSSSSDSESGSESDSDSDSKPAATTKNQEKREDNPKKTVVTERLRSIFKENEESSASFSLFGGNDSDSDDDVGAVDDDQDTNKVEDSIPPQERHDDDDEEPVVSVITSRKRTQFDKLPLFFPHPESAFLDAQSQFNKIPDRPPLSREQWKEEFYENRGEWTRKAKRRRRDAVRSRRKMEGGRKRQGRGEVEEGL